MLSTIISALISGILGFAAKFLTDWLAASKNEKAAVERGASAVKTATSEDAAKAERTYAEIATNRPDRAGTTDKLRDGSF